MPDLHGALLIDKAPGITSAKVVAIVKRRLGVKKIGHAGTLDPMATGLLVLLLGHATRLQSLFLESTKEYEGEILLGRSTSTDDITGDTLEEDACRKYWTERTPDQLLASIRESFSGSIAQRPPAVSAVHVDGVRSYKRVRRGEDVVLQSREVHVEFLELEFLSEEILRYRVRCSKGTYIRSLARDIGEHLSSYGCLKTIRRLASTPFSLERAVSLKDIESEKIGAEDFEEYGLGLASLLKDLPRFELSEPEVALLRNGIQRPLEQLEARDTSLASIFEVGKPEPVALLEPSGKEGATAWKLRCIFAG